MNLDRIKNIQQEVVMIHRITLHEGKSVEFVPPPQNATNQDKPILGGLRRNLSKCCGEPITTTGGGIRRDICSKCKKTIRENRLC